LCIIGNLIFSISTIIFGKKRFEFNPKIGINCVEVNSLDLSPILENMAGGEVFELLTLDLSGF
jgi:hypothetical protein